MKSSSEGKKSNSKLTRIEKLKNNKKIPKITPMNSKQEDYIKALNNNEVIVAIGLPGTSKTYIPSALGAHWLESKQIDKVIIARSSEGPGKDIGHLPGTLEEKIGAYMVPVLDSMKSILGSQKLDACLERGQIEFCHLKAIKGRTLDDCLLIVDEAEDIDIHTMKAIITRIGINCTISINGDIKQQNLKGKSGLKLIQELSEVIDIELPVIEFEADDIVRSDTCKSIILGLIKLGYY